MINIETSVTIFFIVLALVWGFWMIFKRDLLGNNLGKILSYFLGVIITLLVVLWMTAWFLPWWTVRLVENTRESQNVQQLQIISKDLWQEAIAPKTTVSVPTENPQGQQPQVTPAANVTQPAPTGEVSEQSLGQQYYTVQSGDTLYSISKRYNVDVNDLKTINNLQSDNIKVGQKLLIPRQ